VGGLSRGAADQFELELEGRETVGLLFMLPILETRARIGLNRGRSLEDAQIEK